MFLYDIQQIIGELAFRDWRFKVITESEVATAARAFLVVEFDAPCSVSGEAKIQRSRKWLLSPHMTRGEIVQTALLAVRTALEHEMRENFKYRDAAVFGPHFDIDLLRELCLVNATEYRPEPEPQKGAA